MTANNNLGCKSYEGYDQSFHELVKAKYGTVQAFADAMEISYPTAIKYMRKPASIFGVKGAAFYNKVFTSLGVPMCDAMAKYGMQTQ